MKQFTIGLVFILLPVFCLAQEVDSTAIRLDSLKQLILTQQDTIKKRGFIGRLFKDDYPSPKKAAWIALVLPGGGQIYNKQYWKLPIVYGGYFGIFTQIRANRQNYIKYRDARIDLILEHIDSFEGISDPTSLQRIRDGYRSQLELWWIGMVGLHLLQTVDAFVFAHLKNFDVNEDLSMKIGPSYEWQPDIQSPAIGIGLTLNVKSKSNNKPLFIPFDDPINGR